MHSGQFNQAGDLAPRTGPYGRAFAAAVPTMQPLGYSEVIRYRRPYGGWVGALLITGVADKAIVPGMAYGGDAPSAIQPTIMHVPPYLSLIR